MDQARHSSLMGRPSSQPTRVVSGFWSCSRYSIVLGHCFWLFRPFFRRNQDFLKNNKVPLLCGESYSPLIAAPIWDAAQRERPHPPYWPRPSNLFSFLFFCFLLVFCFLILFSLFLIYFMFYFYFLL
jgi:hypothetical protein